jgi:hypothetical protein
MKFYFSVLLVTAVLSRVHAQSTPPITEYFDKNWETTTDPATASYYRTVEQNDRGFLVRDYYISGKMQMEAECMEANPLHREGRSILYYENGNVEQEGRYHFNDKVGLHKWYYENGKPKKEVLYDGKKIRYNHYWSEAGDDELADGEGVFVESSNDKYDHYQSIRDFLVVDAYSIKRGTGDTLYMVVESMPEYPGGYGQIGDGY